MFGAGGGTSSYQEVQDTDVILLWGSNAREAHPIFFHHVLKAIHDGARMYAIDPRRTTTAQWADTWLGLNVGSDVALANGMAREIIHAGLHNREFIRRGTSGFEAYAAAVEPYTLERAEALSGVPADVIKEVAHTYARADRAQICWTLGITEHHNAVDNVLALINLALLTGHVGRYGSGLNPLRGQNNVQGGGDMGAIPNRLPGFQDIETDPEAREKYERAWGVKIQPKYGWHMTEMFDAIDRGELTTMFVLGENPIQSDADATHVRHLFESLDHLVVQDIFRTATAELADVVLPASASWCEAEGTVTNSERRVQRVRAALKPPGNARDDVRIMVDLAARLGHEWEYGSTEDVWNELRSLAPNHAGMSYKRLEELGGIQWPCFSEDRLEPTFLHGRLWKEPLEGPPAVFHAVEDSPPTEELSDEFPLRLTTGRRLDSFNTGVQTGGYTSPLRRGEELELSTADAEQLGVTERRARARIVGPRQRGRARAHRAVAAPGAGVHDAALPRRGETNLLTINATDPKSGTAEFKATAIRVDRIGDGDQDAEEVAAAGLPRSAVHLMDLVIQNELPTAAEREAVDAVLGPPGSSWEGAPQASERDQRVARGGHAARAQRHLLLPTLHAVQARVGWISRGALNYVCRRLTIPPAEAYGVASFYALFSLEPEPPVVVHVCTDVACIGRGSQELVAELERRVGPEGEHPGNGQAVWHESPCLGMCEFAPAAMLTVAGEAPHEASVARVSADDVAGLLAGGAPPPAPPPLVPQAGDPSLRLLRRVGRRRPRAASTATARTAATRRCAPRSRWGPTGCCAR